MMVDRSFDAVHLAHYVVDKCAADDEPVSNLLLQKMLYFLQYVYCSVTHGDLLFSDEFEAWPYGPVLRTVYFEYKFYGAAPINERYEPSELPEFGDIKSFIDDGITDLRRKYPWDLVRISHAEGSPWWIVWNSDSENKTIDNSLIIQAATRN